MASRSDDRVIPAQSLYERIYSVIAQIPPGYVATYGQIAAIVGGCSARVVGYALAATPKELTIPWQRVINSRGEVSARRQGGACSRQRTLLEDEGVVFDGGHRIDFAEVGWEGPDWEWLRRHNCYQAPPAGFPQRGGVG
ncbi:MAG: MGMT family protein [Gammaproteobacteria bacterium]|nr:MGMT family protein [Gammaproteobacteria bacterium]